MLAFVVIRRFLSVSGAPFSQHFPTAAQQGQRSTATPLL
jgi:hypothetical protein